MFDVGRCMGCQEYKWFNRHVWYVLFFFLQSLTKNRDLSPIIIGATVGKIKNPAIMMGLDGKSWRLYVSLRPAKNNHYGDYPGLDGDITSLQ